MDCSNPSPRFIDRALASCQNTLVEPEIAPGQVHQVDPEISTLLMDVLLKSILKFHSNYTVHKTANCTSALFGAALLNLCPTLAGKYPMYVVSFEYFINMRYVQSHQELLSLDILVEFTEEMLGPFLILWSCVKTKTTHRIIDIQVS